MYCIAVLRKTKGTLAMNIPLYFFLFANIKFKEDLFTLHVNYYEEKQARHELVFGKISYLVIFAIYK